MKFNVKLIFSAALAIILLVVFCPFVIIPGGHAAVVFSRQSGVEHRVLSEGFHAIVPLVEQVIPHDVRTQSLVFKDEEAVTKDQQLVHTDVTVNYHPIKDQLNLLYQEVGLDYAYKIVEPTVREALKAEFAKYQVSQLLDQRGAVSQAIVDYTMTKLAEKHLLTELISLTNVRFSPNYQEAVEAKQVALQQAEAAVNKLEQAKVEAQITETNADAEAYKVAKVSEALAKNPSYINLEAIRTLNPKAQVVYVPQNANVLIPGFQTPSK
ncbi:MAG: prohibitin family protein [Leptolyngbya sp.]|nr:prohibitin family protein [Candidatus Melainabacteria bacterium]